MKTKLILFLLCLASLNVMGQGTIQRSQAEQSFFDNVIVAHAKKKGV